MAADNGIGNAADNNIAPYQQLLAPILDENLSQQPEAMQPQAVQNTVLAGPATNSVEVGTQTEWQIKTDLDQASSEVQNNIQTLLVEAQPVGLTSEDLFPQPPERHSQQAPRAQFKKIEYRQIEASPPDDLDNAAINRKDYFSKKQTEMTSSIAALKRVLKKQQTALEQKKKEISDKKQKRCLLKYMFVCSYKRQYDEQVHSLKAEVRALENDILNTKNRIERRSAALPILADKLAKLETKEAANYLLQDHQQHVRAEQRKRSSAELQHILIDLLEKPKIDPNNLVESELNSANKSIALCDKALDKMTLLLETLQIQCRQIKAQSKPFLISKENRQELKALKVQIVATEKAMLEMREKRAAYADKAMHDKFITEPDRKSQRMPSPLGKVFDVERNNFETREKLLINDLNQLSLKELELLQEQKEIPKKLAALNSAWLLREALDERNQVLSFVSARANYEKQAKDLRSKQEKIPRHLEVIFKLKASLKQELSQLRQTIKATKPLDRLDPKALTKAKLRYDAANSPFMAIIPKECELPNDACVEKLRSYTNERITLQKEINQSWYTTRQKLVKLETISDEIKEVEQNWEQIRNLSSWWKRWRSSANNDAYKAYKSEYIKKLNDVKKAELEAKKSLQDAKIKIAQNSQKLADLQIKQARTLTKHSKDVALAAKQKIFLSQKNAELVAILKPACTFWQSDLESIQNQILTLTDEKESTANPISQTRAEEITEKLNSLTLSADQIKEKLQCLYDIELLEPTAKTLQKAKKAVQSSLCEARKSKRQELETAIKIVSDGVTEKTTSLTTLKQETTAEENQVKHRASILGAINGLLLQYYEQKELANRYMLLLQTQEMELRRQSGWLFSDVSLRAELVDIGTLKTKMERLLSNIEVKIEKLKLEITEL